MTNNIDPASPGVDEHSDDLLSPSAQLRTFMVRWRMRLTLREIGESADNEAAGQITQAKAATLVKSSLLWYGRLERGELGFQYSDTFLDRVATVLRLSAAERHMLWLLAVRRAPSPVQAGPGPIVTEAIEQAVLGSRWPAFLCDHAWNVLACNESMRRWFPHVRRHGNFMRWLFASAHARTQLIEWHSIWAPSAVAQLRYAAALHPDDRSLAELVSKALSRNPVFRRLWHAQAEVKLHFDSDRRQVKPAYTGTVTEVEVVASRLERHDSLKLVMFIPTERPVPLLPRPQPG